MEADHDSLCPKVGSRPGDMTESTCDAKRDPEGDRAQFPTLSTGRMEGFSTDPTAFSTGHVEEF